MKNQIKMKKIILSTVLMAIVVVSCNQKNKPDESVKPAATENTSQLYSCPMHPEVTGKQGDTCSKCGMELTEPVVKTEAVSEEVKTEKGAVTPFSITVDANVNDYLKVKNALVNDDSNGAAAAAKALLATFNAANTTSIDAKLKKEYIEIADDAKEHAEHIADNAGKIEHQREHFALLSRDINDMIKTFGTNKKLYQEYCPMYDQGKSGYWISDSKEIKNPYYGAEMLTCGRVEKEL
ncbi:DUF3347 domain-containing protein [Flavobacterium xanthum]|uniref:Uncharacterized protein n=1 Tax=Flavobacterium xanthum TaxID=69322 RepID=A0A1M6ZYC8_9FLAO|nr:DUF3347 domain-containing protein [Flavobacterium xanthum]SHL35333.1 Protein of unknown function [Flavobacterium xanthum]